MSSPSIRLFVVHNSHPCDAVARALELKGLPFRVTEWPPPLHAALQRVLFGGRTVPAVRIDGESIQGSRAIFARLDALVPDPALYPDAAVAEADRWGDEVFQQVARDLIWVAAGRVGGAAMVAYSEGSRIPLPAPAVRASAPLIIAAARRLNRTGDAQARRRLAELPELIARIDGWIADGTIGDPDRPNAADLQILSTVRLLVSIEDVRPHFAGSRAPELAERLFGGPVRGRIPAGTLA